MKYLGYILSSSDAKTRWLLHYARRDAYFAPIVKDLNAFGYEITHSFFEGNGAYVPYALSVNSVDFRNEFLKAVARGEMKARFRLTPRHGPGAAAFHFLHELVHFHQDMNGLFLYPLQIDGKESVQPDLASQIALNQFCEAMAATESIRAAYRLKKIGYPQAWRGAMGSVNWRGLARKYARNLRSGLFETDAAQRLFQGWYQEAQAGFYEKQVRAAYRPMPPEYERRVDVPDYVAVGKPSGPKHSDVFIGTPPYLWKSLKT